MKKIIISLLFIISSISGYSQIYGWMIRVSPDQDPDTANVGIMYPSGSANLTGRMHFVSWQTLADSIGAFISGGIDDGDKGDITVSGGGLTWNIDANTIGNPELKTDWDDDDLTIDNIGNLILRSTGINGVVQLIDAETSNNGQLYIDGDGPSLISDETALNVRSTYIELNQADGAYLLDALPPTDNTPTYELAVNGDGYIQKTDPDGDRSETNELIDTVFNYTNLRAYTGLNKVVWVQKSGIEGLFVQVSTGTENGATIIVGTDLRKWKRVFYDNRYNLLWWNSTDASWSNEMQSAIDLISDAGYGTLVIPEGTYQLATTGVDPYNTISGGDLYYCVELKSNVTIENHGTLTLPDSTIAYTPPNLDSTDRVNIFIGDSIQNVRISGGIIDGNSEGQYQEIDGAGGCGYYGQIFGCAIAITEDGAVHGTDFNNRNISIEDVTFLNHSGNPINASFLDSCQFRRLNYIGFGEGFQLIRSRNCVIEGITGYFNSTSCGDGFELSNCINIHTSNIDISGDGGGTAIDLFGCQQCVVESFYIHDYFGSGIDIASVAATDFESDNVILRNGVVDSCGGYGIAFKGDTLGDIVLQNVRSNYNQNGFWLNDGQLQFIEQLKLFDCDATYNQTSGLQVRAFKNLIIQGGNYSNNGQDGIFMIPQVYATGYGSNNIRMTGTTLANNGQYGIYIQDSGGSYGPVGHLDLYAYGNATNEIINEFADTTPLTIRNIKPFLTDAGTTTNAGGESMLYLTGNLTSLTYGSHGQLLTVVATGGSRIITDGSGIELGTGNIALPDNESVLLRYDAFDQIWYLQNRSDLASGDHDWYEVGGTSPPNAITDDMFHTGKVAIGATSGTNKLDVTFSGNDGLALRNSGNTGGDFAVIDFQQGGAQKAVMYTNSDNFTMSAGAGLFNIGGQTGINLTPTTGRTTLTGIARITGSDGTALAPMGRDADGDISAMTEGAGIDFTAGAIINSGDTDGTNDVLLTGDQSIAGVKTFTSDPIIPDEAYDATAWNGSLEPPTKNAVRDKIETLSAGSAHTIRDDGSDETQRAALNFVSTSTIDMVGTDDAGNNETEIAASVVAGSIGDNELGTGIDVTQLADGTVTSSEFQFINTLTSNAQTQINTKAPIDAPTFTTSLTLPVSGGYAPTADGSIGYDNTQEKYVAGSSGGVTGSFPLIKAMGHPAESKINSTSSDQDYSSIFTIPANVLIENKAYKVVLFFEATTGTSSATVTTYLKIGSTKCYSTGLININNGITRSVAMEFYVQGTAAAGASANVLTFPVSLPIGINDASANSVAQPQALATNGSLAFTPGVTWSSTGSTETMVFEGYQVWEIN